MLDLFPDAQVFYLGLFREKVSLSPVEYYQVRSHFPSRLLFFPSVEKSGRCQRALGNADP
jgi:hypothetical protein